MGRYYYSHKRENKKSLFPGVFVNSPPSHATYEAIYYLTWFDKILRIKTLCLLENFLSRFIRHIAVAYILISQKEGLRSLALRLDFPFGVPWAVSLVVFLIISFRLFLMVVHWDVCWFPSYCSSWFPSYCSSWWPLVVLCVVPLFSVLVFFCCPLGCSSCLPLYRS